MNATGRQYIIGKNGNVVGYIKGGGPVASADDPRIKNAHGIRFSTRDLSGGREESVSTNWPGVVYYRSEACSVYRLDYRDGHYYYRGERRHKSTRFEVKQ